MIRIVVLKIILITLFIILIFSFSQVTKVYAQSPSATNEETVKKYGITFPIEDLGNCANLSQCKLYCDDPLHANQCIDFAKKKGFYKEEKAIVENSSIINSAKAELGCGSQDSCRQFCGEQQNWQKCGEFAKKHNLSGGQKEDPAKSEILTKAKQVLGCDSYDSCKSFCERPENKQKCDEFAKIVGLRGGIEKKGPGGCTSQESCKAFCSDPGNFQICQEFTKSQGVTFKGPGGCTSEIACRAYCGQHETECKAYFSKGPNMPTYSRQEMCLRTPSCKWTGDHCACGSGSTEYKGPKATPAYDNADARARFCRQDPEKCKNTGQFSPSPSTSDLVQKCAQYGCSWTGTSCDCSSKTPYPTYYPKSSYYPQTSYSPYPTPSYEEICRSKTGCNWTGSTCQCSTSSSLSPVPTATPTTNTLTNTAVQGISTVRSALEAILEWFAK